MAVLLGDNTDAGNDVAVGASGEVRAFPMVAAASGTIASVSFKLTEYNSGTRLAIYDNAGSSPGALLGWIEVPAGVATNQIVTLSFPAVSIVSGTTYWISDQGETTASRITRGTTPGSVDLNFDNTSGWGVAPPDPFVKDSGISSTTRLIYFEDTGAAPNPTLRKGGSATIDKPAGIGTITGVTLNGNAITLDSQTVDDFTVTDSDGTITTSGTYDLVATGDTVETIAVQVNVVGLPTNTAKKDGGLLTSLADLTLDAVNSSGTVVKQLTGLTTDAGGIISPVDLSDISEAIGDTLKVSLHSAAADVGVTFEQALEAI